MTDYISRQEAIEYFMTNTNWHDEEGYPIDDAEEKRELLEGYFSSVPSADVREIRELPDGTLSIKVDDALKVGRVLVQDNNHWGSLYYPDEASSVDVVRCKDCKYWHVGSVKMTCRKGIIVSPMATGYDYCSYGEEKINEQTL